MRVLRRTSTFILLAALAACASHPAPPSQVPAALTVAQGQTLFLEALASGVQIYQCSQKADGSFEGASDPRSDGAAIGP